MIDLLMESYEPFNFMEKRKTPDGAGGFFTTWTVGAEFSATADFSTSNIATIADKVTERVNCIITTQKAITLSPFDVIMRKSDGTIFRILSDGKNNATPKSAALNMRQSLAEIWTLPSNEG